MSTTPINASEQSWWDSIQQKLYSIPDSLFGGCDTDVKVYTLLIIGRALQAAAIAGFVFALASTVFFTPVAIAGIIPAIAAGILGTYIAGNPQEVAEALLPSPYVAGQPVGLFNSGNNCWLNSSLQLLMHSTHYHPRLREIPEFGQFMNAYHAAEQNNQKAVHSFNTHGLRQFLHRATSGQVDSGSAQQDAAQLFEYLLQGNRGYALEQQLSGAAPTVHNEPMISINLGLPPRPGFQQLFAHFFDHHTDDGRQVQLFFQRPPEDLLIQCKRFIQYWDSTQNRLVQEKINDPIDLPEHIALPPAYVRTGESSQYACDSFLIHQGEHLQNGGHYIAYIKKADTWWCVNDMRTYPVSANDIEALRQNAYIAHFAKVS